MATKLRALRVHVLEAGSPEELESELNGWLAGTGEEELVDLLFQVSDDTYVVLVLYTQ